MNKPAKLQPSQLTMILTLSAAFSVMCAAFPFTLEFWYCCWDFWRSSPFGAHFVSSDSRLASGSLCCFWALRF